MTNPGHYGSPLLEQRAQPEDLELASSTWIMENMLTIVREASDEAQVVATISLEATHSVAVGSGRCEVHIACIYHQLTRKWSWGKTGILTERRLFRQGSEGCTFVRFSSGPR